MALSCGGSCLKFLVFFFNAIVFVGGAVFSGFGIFLLIEAKKSNETFAVTLPAFVTAFGLLIFVLGFLGCFGACYENRCMLLTFAAIVTILLIGEFVCGIILLVYRAKFVELAGEALKKQIKLVESSSSSESEATMKGINEIQEELKCCGGTGPSDWKTVPDSCCPLGTTKVCKNPYKTGCASAMYEFIKDKALAAALVLVCICLLQIGAIVCACCLAKKLKGYEKV